MMHDCIDRCLSFYTHAYGLTNIAVYCIKITINLTYHSLLLHKQVSKYNYKYIIVCPKASSAGLICHTHQLTASDCQAPNGHILGDQPEEGTDGYRWKDFEKRKVL